MVVGGVAWAQTRGIEAVEISIDGGPFRPGARGGGGDDSWRQWRHEWDATPGRHTLVVRATDGTGEVQTEERSETLPDGASGWMSLVVTVDPDPSPTEGDPSHVPFPDRPRRRRPVRPHAARRGVRTTATSAADPPATEAPAPAPAAPADSAEICDAEGLVEAVETGPDEGTLAGMTDDPVATAASSNPVLTTLVGAVGEAGLVDTLNSAPA